MARVDAQAQGDGLLEKLITVNRVAKVVKVAASLVLPR